MKIKCTDSVMNTSIASNKLGVSSRLLKKYEHEGLIITEKTKAGHSLYSKLDLNWIEFLYQQIKINNVKIADVKILLALIPCWEIKNSCSQEYCKDCIAYKNYNVVCWVLEKQESRICKEDSCRDCEVYHYSTNSKYLRSLYAVRQ